MSGSLRWFFLHCIARPVAASEYAGRDVTTNSKPTTRRVPTLILVLGPALLAAAVYANTLRNGLLYDDPPALARAQAPIGQLLTRRYGLTSMSIKLDMLVWGSSPAGLHLTNVLLGALGAALSSVCALVLSGSSLIALLCGLLFAVHPVHVEAVASIENRKEMLAMVFVMASTILWSSRRRPWWCYWGSLACLALAMSAKEVAAVGLVGMLPLTDVLLGTRGRREARARILPLLTFGLAARRGTGAMSWSGSPLRRSLG